MEYQRYSLLIDSKKRQNQAEQNTNFTVNLNNLYNIKVARLKSGCIPLSYYNIDETNNIMSYSLADLSGTFHSFSFTIPNGRYNQDSIMTTINNKFQQQPNQEFGTLNLTYNKINGVFTITETPGPNSMPLIYLETVTFTLDNLPLSNFLGFTPSPFSVINGINYVATSSVAPNFVNTDYLKITLNNLSSGLLNIDNSPNNTTFIVEVDNDYSIDYLGKNISILNYGEDTGCKNNVYNFPIQLQNFKVTLTDRNDRIVNLHGVDWWCIVELIVAIPIAKVIEQDLKLIPPVFPNEPSYITEKNAQNKAKADAYNQSIPLWMRPL